MRFASDKRLPNHSRTVQALNLRKLLVWLHRISMLILGNGWARFALAPLDLRSMDQCQSEQGHCANSPLKMPSIHVATEVSVWFDALICPLRAQVTLYRVSACSRQTRTVRPINSVHGYSQGQSANPERLSLCLHASEISIAFCQKGLRGLQAGYRVKSVSI